MPSMQYAFYVGVDWGSERHQVCVLDAERRVVGERTVEHSGPGLAELAEWLVGLTSGPPERIAVALEVPRGAVVDTLLSRGLHLFAINPKQLDRFRDRHSVAGAKDDRRDAFVLAAALGPDRWAFRRLEPDHPLMAETKQRGPRQGRKHGCQEHHEQDRRQAGDQGASEERGAVALVNSAGRRLPQQERQCGNRGGKEQWPEHR